LIDQRAYKKNVERGTGSSPTIFGGGGFAGLSITCGAG